MPSAQIPTEAKNILAQIYRLPNFDGLPLYATTFQKPEQLGVGEISNFFKFYAPRMQLETTSITEATISPKLFDYPTDFKKVKFEYQIMQDQDATDRGNATMELFKK